MWGRLQPGFSLRGTSVLLERLAGTCGRLAEATPQAHLCPHLFPMAYTDEFLGFRGQIFVQTGPAGGAAEARPTSRILRASIIALTLASVAAPGFADDPLLNRGDVKKALAYIEANHSRTLQSQVTIAEIPAPTFHEAERAKYLASEFRRVGLASVESD